MEECTPIYIQREEEIVLYVVVYVQREEEIVLYVVVYVQREEEIVLYVVVYVQRERRKLFCTSLSMYSERGGNCSVRRCLCTEREEEIVLYVVVLYIYIIMSKLLNLLSVHRRTKY
jgi:hypothetical protein